MAKLGKASSHFCSQLDWRLQHWEALDQWRSEHLRKWSSHVMMLFCIACNFRFPHPESCISARGRGCDCSRLRSSSASVCCQDDCVVLGVTQPSCIVDWDRMGRSLHVGWDLPNRPVFGQVESLPSSPFSHLSPIPAHHNSQGWPSAYFHKTDRQKSYTPSNKLGQKAKALIHMDIQSHACIIPYFAARQAAFISVNKP